MWRNPLFYCAASGAALLGLGILAAQDPLELPGPTAPPALVEVPREVELPDEVAPAALTTDPTADPDVEVLTRGPVHEAYAEQFNYDPQPGLAVAKQPPEVIREVPPEVKPDDDDAIWVPGYWAWDDERSDYLWISGCWRVPPPDHRWVPGYWSPLADGRHQWISGFWTPTSSGELSYLPTPPASLEEGPVGEAPANHFWVPGNWQYVNTSYNWTPGYYAPCYDDWMWIPSRYIWTPRGCIFVPGRWDYRLASRGCLFAPCYFPRPAPFYTVRYYSPTVCVPTSTFSLHLFVRPSYCHYYFGDWYGPRYRTSFSAWFSFGSRPRCYDPMFSYYNVHFRRHGVDYQRRMHDWHDHFERHADLRPAHTFRAQVEFTSKRPDFAHSKQSQIATSIAYMKRDPGDMKIKSVDFEERKQLTVARKQAEMIGKQRASFEKKVAGNDDDDRGRNGRGPNDRGPNDRGPNGGPDDRGPRNPNFQAGKPGENGMGDNGKTEVAKLKLGQTTQLQAKKHVDFDKPNRGNSGRPTVGVDPPGDNDPTPNGNPNKPPRVSKPAFVPKTGTLPLASDGNDDNKGPKIRGNDGNNGPNGRGPNNLNPPSLDRPKLPGVNPNVPRLNDIPKGNDTPRTFERPKPNDGPKFENKGPKFENPTPKFDPPKIDRTPKIETPKFENKPPKFEAPKIDRAPKNDRPPKVEKPAGRADIQSVPQFAPRIASEPKFSDGSGGGRANFSGGASRPRIESAPVISRPAVSQPSFRANPGGGGSGNPLGAASRGAATTRSSGGNSNKGHGEKKRG